MLGKGVWVEKNFLDAEKEDRNAATKAQAGWGVAFIPESFVKNTFN